MIDSDSPVTFTTKDLKNVLHTIVLLGRPVPHSKKFVDIDVKLLNGAGFIHVQPIVGKQAIKRVRNLVAANGRWLVGWD